MSRPLTPEVQSALAATQQRPAFLVEFEFAATTRRYWTGGRTLAWRGVDWQGVGRNGGFTNIDEGGEVKASGVSFTLAGIDTTADPDFLQLADLYTRQGGKAALWFALFDSAWSLIRDPWLLYRGLVDVPIIRQGADGASITLSTETRLSRQSQRQGLRYTDEDHRRRHAGDRFFEYVAEMQEKNIDPGASTGATGTSSSILQGRFRAVRP